MKIILLEPFLVDVIWGGIRLKEFGYSFDSKNIGEAWTISAIKDKSSKIVFPENIEKNLFDFYQNNKSFFGNYQKEYPLLVKIIDANKDLSIQVHPDNEYALKNHNKLGKSECWYILDACENAEIIYGHNAKNKEELISFIKNNQWEKLLLKHKVFKNDFINVPPGTIHAIKSNTLIYELQQSSDITYRLYDYDRLDNNGNKRELHIEKSIDVITYPQNNLEIVKTSNNLIIDNQYFTLFKIENELSKEYFFKDALWVQGTVIEGEGLIDNLLIKKGSNFLVRTNEKFVLNGKLTILISYLKKTN